MPNALSFDRSSLFPRLHPVLGLWLLVGFALSMAGGCRGLNDSQVALMERELRQKEDYTYELEDDVLEYSEKLRNCRGLLLHYSMATSSEETTSPEETPEPELAIDKPRKTEATSKKQESEETLIPELLDTPELEIDPLDIDIPELEINQPSASTWRNPETIELAVTEEAYEPDFESDTEQQGFIPNLVDYGSDFSIESELPLEELSEDSSEELVAEKLVAFDNEPAELGQIVITKVFRNLESDSEHGSLLTVVEVLDTEGRPAEVQGEVSLMIRTNLGEKPKRLERWDFDAEETFSAWQSSPLGEGLHLELPIESKHLPDEPLELLARLATDDGRIWLTSLMIEPTQLAMLEAETGAEQLIAAENLSSDELVAVESPTNISSKDPSETESKLAKDSQPRWRASLQRSDDLATDYSSTAQPKTQRWTSQPLGGRPLARSTTMASKPRPPATANSTGPPSRSSSWTSSRLKLKIPVQPAKPTAPGWSAWR